MTIQEVIRKNQAFKRSIWKNWVILSDDGQEIVKQDTITRHPKSKWFSIELTIDDILATDWEVFNERYKGN